MPLLGLLFRVFAILGILLVPVIAQAHEVYVLTSQQIATGLATPAFNMSAIAYADISRFLFWGFVTALTIFVVFFISILRVVENVLDPVFMKLRRYAAPIARITVGISFIAAAYYQASYGPELPLIGTFGAYTIWIRLILVAIGILIIFGIYARLAALIALVLFTIAVWFHGIYMLTYTNYLGEILVLLILGAHHGAYEKRGAPSFFDQIGTLFAPYSFFVLRVFFGISLFYASIYAKILHNDLALQVASLPLAGHAHSIASVLGFEPHFLVLGAAIIEIVIAVFFILGLEIRFTSLFLLFWLSLSLIYFGEVVWPHIILIGIPIAFICWGYDSYSLEGKFFKQGAREPVL